MSEARFDVSAIMARIREHNRAARERGVLSDEDVEELARARFRRFAEKAHIDPRLLERFLGPGHDWNISSDYLIRTHRQGLVWQLSLVLKRLVRPVVRLYTDHLIDRQTQVNQYLFHLSTHTIREVVRLEARLHGLERRCAALEAGRATPGDEPK